jgi:hypothetical protein
LSLPGQFEDEHPRFTRTLACPSASSHVEKRMAGMRRKRLKSLDNLLNNQIQVNRRAVNCA